MANPISDLKKVGEAKLKVLFWNVYNSSLYTTSGQYRPDSFPQALRIEYLRDIEAEDLLESTQEEWEKLGLSPETFTPWLAQLADIFPNISEDDILLLTVEGGQKSTFFYNGKIIGEVTDPGFGESFLRIWLDENSSYPKLRNKLIGLK